MADRDRSWQYALAGALLVAGPLARQLYYARYPLTSPEAMVLVTGLAVSGAAIAGLGFRLGRALSGVVFAGLLLLFLDLQFDFRRPIVFGGVAALCLLFALLLGRWRASITGLVLGGFYLAALPLRSPDEVTTRQAGRIAAPRAVRPIVHLILDEHLGIGGFRGIGDTLTANFLTDFYVRRGFDVYPGAYSRFNVTRMSIVSVLSLGEVDESALLTPERGGVPAPLARNPYFARLAGEGYRLNVYQSANLDFCQTSGVEIATCTRVPPTSVSNISYLRIPWTQKARLVLEFHIMHSSSLRWLHPRGQEVASRHIFAARGLELLRAASHDFLSRQDRAEFFFAHVLLPHAPYELDDECVTYLERLRAPGTLKPTPDSLRNSREARYRAQVRCLHRAVGQILDQVEEVFGRNQAVIIIHGDHGSRATHRCEPNIVCNPPAATEAAVRSFRPLDFTAEFATLLAVRSPGGAGAVHWEATPLQDFLWAFIKSGFQPVPPTPWQHYIYLNAPGGNIAHPLRPVDMLWAPSPKPERPGAPP